jgi:hypothetical protein
MGRARDERPLAHGMMRELVLLKTEIEKLKARVAALEQSLWPRAELVTRD